MKIKTKQLKKNETLPSIDLKQLFLFFHEKIQHINNSKLFAGFIVITLNIASKFVTFKLSKSMESYFKNTFSRNILVFCIAWMGCREIYIAFLITILFIIFVDFLFNEKSNYCVLPETFTTYHTALMEETPPTQEEINNAKQVLLRAQKMENGL